jgi:excisionase family DNA binding protein
MAELYLTTEQVAERLQLHPETIRRQIQSGRLRAIRRGRVYRIPESAIEENSPQRIEAPAGQAQAIMRDLQSRDGRTRNAAIVALTHASPSVRAIVEAAAEKAAQAYYSTPEGQEELSDWIGLQSEPFEFPDEQRHEERAT